MEVLREWLKALAVHLPEAQYLAAIGIVLLITYYIGTDKIAAIFANILVFLKKQPGPLPSDPKAVSDEQMHAAFKVLKAGLRECEPACKKLTELFPYLEPK